MEKILVAMDDSEASRRLLSAVAVRARESKDVRLVLCHVLPPLPPELLESRGSEKTEEEERIERDQEIAQAKWAKKQVAESERLLAESRKVLEDHGIAADRIETEVTELPDGHEKLVDELLGRAKDLGCGTIAVGRKSFPIFREILNAHLGEKLQRHATGIEVWIVD